jgi:SUMO ligase MMS21 Smc5/6 complex component
MTRADKPDKDNELLIEFRTAVWNVNHEDEPLPPMTRWLGREGDDESDDELEYGGTIQTYRCPISLTHLVDAYKSTKCGHHYSHAAIMNHIASSGQRRGAKCPVGACTAIITRADLLVRSYGLCMGI